MNTKNQSEVARLLQQISEEYEAATRGLSGLASGTARHDFITKKMENMGQNFEDLAEAVGSKQEAMAIFAQVLARLPEEGSGHAQC